jgi:nucleotide-binding universal stress UspA family protein
MQPFRTILVAVDFSENAVHAFRVACSLAVADQTRLAVLHVGAPALSAKTHASPSEAAAGPTEPPGTEDLHPTLERKMREVYSPNRPIAVEYRTAEGDAAREILRVADEIEADLIVTGTHGRTGLRRLLAGSVAATVLVKARCSVLALRAGHRAHQTDAMQTILHPTDFSRASEVALKVARSLAGDHGARLIVLHVVPLDIYVDGRMAAGIDTRDYRDSLDRLRQRLDGPDLKHPVETRLGRGFEGEEILREAEELACDLIVMGTHSRTGLRRVLMGNTAESVLPKANCPVLVVKGPPILTSSTSVSSPARAGAELVS